MSETVLSPAKQELLLRLRGAAHASPGGPVPLRGGTGSPTLVLVYPVGGALFCYAALTAALETSSPVYGFADAGELAVPGDHYDLLSGAAAARVARVVGEVLRR